MSDKWITEDTAAAPTRGQIEAAYIDLLLIDPTNPARAIHAQRALAVLRDLISWMSGIEAERLQSSFEFVAEQKRGK